MTPHCRHGLGIVGSDVARMFQTPSSFYIAKPLSAETDGWEISEYCGHTEAEALANVAATNMACIAGNIQCVADTTEGKEQGEPLCPRSLSQNGYGLLLYYYPPTSLDRRVRVK